MSPITSTRLAPLLATASQLLVQRIHAAPSPWLSIRDTGVGVLDTFIPPNRNDDQYYNVNVSFAGQILPCLVDTGSGDIFVASQDCSTTDVDSGCYELKEQYMWTGNEKILANETFGTTVGQGTVIGNQTLMNVSFGGVTAENLATGLIYDAATLEFQDGSFAGIWGLGMLNVSRQWYFNDRLPPVDALIRAGELKKPLFSLTLPRLGDIDSPATGKLTLGDIEPEFAGSDIAYGEVLDTPNYNYEGSPLQTQGWIIQLEGIRMNGVEINMTQGALDPEGRYMSMMDSGSPTISFRWQDLNAIMSLVKGTKVVQDSYAVYFDCSVPQLLELKYNGRWFPIDPLDLIIPSDHGNSNGTELCKAALGNWSRTFADSIVGVPFLRSVLSVYDYVSSDMYSVRPQVGLVSLVDAQKAEARYPDLYKNRLL